MELVTDLYPLTSLQIGDTQAYLSQAYLFFARASHKFLILVDNHSWRMNNNHSASIHLRELLAMKYRPSPFKNTRPLVRHGSARYKDTSIASDDERKRLYKWVSFVNSRRWRVTALFPLVDLHVALHGFIVFEVSWDDIRGINYYNVLQDLMEFASPVWLLFYDAGSYVYDALSSMVFSICSLFAALFQPLISPFLLLYSYLISIVAFFRPLFCWLWKLFQVPLGVCSAIGNHAVSFCNDIYEVLEGLLIIILNRVTEICHLATRLSEAKPATTEVSMWNSLWKDLFSKLFRALRSILNGLIAFLDSFNRHRFSTSNQLRKYSRCLSRLLSSGMGGSPLVLSPAEGCQKEVSENHEHID